MEGVSVTVNELAIAAWNLSYEQFKQIKWLTFGIVCTAAGGYLTYRLVKKQVKRIDELEKTVNTLVQLAVADNQQEQQPESE